MVFLNSFQNHLNQKRIVFITFQGYDFLKNHIFPEYAGGLVKASSSLPPETSVFLQKPHHQNSCKILQLI